MRKRLTALLMTAALLVMLVGSALPTSALWVKTSMLAGDVDASDKINTSDARLTLQYAAGRIGEEALDLTLADVSGDGKVNTTDARLILQYAAGRITEFPCGELYTATLSEAETTPNENPETFATYTSGNPIITTLYTADPSAHVWNDGRIYLYPSHDIDPPAGCDLMNKYHVFSSDNMVDWVDEGQILEAADVMWSNCTGFMWAPDCAYIEETDTYYYFFPHPLTDDQIVVGVNENGEEKLDRGWNYTWVMGVAKSVGSPTGPFEQVGYVKIGDGVLTDGQIEAVSNVVNKNTTQTIGFFDSTPYASLTAYDGKTLGDHGVSGMAVGGFSLIDPCVFVDEDGTVYLYYGGGGNCYVVELADDMVTATTMPKKLIGLTDFHEGSWIFKNPETGFYYAMYADNSSGNNQLCYAASTSPTGPFSYGGVLLEKTDCDTSHGSICQYKGNWYLFYHNSKLSGGVTNLRSTCVDQLYFNENGTIQLVKQTTTGVAAVGPSNIDPIRGVNIPLSAYTVSTDYDTADAVVEGGATVDANGVIGNLHIAGSYCEFANINGGSGGKALLTVTYSFFTASGSAKVSTNSAYGDGEYSLPLTSTGGWSNFQETTCLIDLDAGTDNVIRFYGGTGFNIKSIKVSLLPEASNA